MPPHLPRQGGGAAHLRPRPDHARRKAHRVTPLTRLLISSQFAFNVGFFAVLPYLADHLGGALGLGGALVGLVLGLRTFSQQGLFVVGGALTDRYGPRPLVLVGCALRIAGFVWLALAASAWTVIGAVVLVGFAAALFSPAVESEIAREALRVERSGGPRRTRTLARFSAGGQAGALLGPVIGALLLHGAGDAHFRTACLAGAGVFAVVLAAHARLLPRGGGRERSPGEWRAVLGERRFLRLALAYSTYLLAYNQLYLALPAELDRATGSQAALGWLFALSSALVVFGSGPLERLASARLDSPAMVRAGLFLTAAAFAATAALGSYGGLWAAVTFTVLLTLGQMLVLPATRALLPDLVDERHLGLATGALSSLAGLVVLAAAAPVGALLDHRGPTPWLLLAATPLLGLTLVPAGPGTAKAGPRAGTTTAVPASEQRGLWRRASGGGSRG
ncbi:MFS transporter [Streptomyces sp. NPDC058326]|uniref:MFS transporter n=1 Tax=Streptomyces sp. NPDC058326 TaxID=3346447 RepID=UPI0036F12CF3